MEDLIAEANSTQIQNNSHTSNASNGESLRLPMIQPPTFNGNLEDWASLIDTFNALFHNNSQLNDVQRLHYLKSSLSGPAADIVTNFSITSENYNVAYEELVRKYENKGLTIQTHIRSLLMSPKVNSPSAAELRNLHHHVASHVRALKALAQPVEHWDAWLVTLICSQLDATTAGEWQLRQDNKELPSYQQIESFLSKRVVAYEVGLASNQIAERPVRSKTSNNSKAFFTRPVESKVYKCPICTQQHKIYSCERFTQMSVAKRKKAVSNARLCFNYLNYGHQVKDCRLSSCPKCNQCHNSKLHDDTQSTNTPVPSSSGEQAPAQVDVPFTGSVNVQDSQAKLNIMLSTSLINVQNKEGKWHRCRAVLDSGSQLNFITNECAKRLGLSQSINDQQCISGVGTMASSVSLSYSAVICSRVNEYQLNAILYALPVIVNTLPSQMIDCSQLTLPKHIKNKLADLNFHVPGNIDLLLGSEVFFNILGTERWSFSDHASLHHTQFGWIVAGKLPIIHHTNAISSINMLSSSALSLFTNQISQRTSEEVEKEKHFRSTTRRNPDGRFVVKLPVLQDPKVLGDSCAMAQRHFFNLEKRLTKDPSLAMQYKSFMDEYLELDHMELVNEVTNCPIYYLPHHPVFKAESSTTKMRVVFDGSAVASSGLSLNDILLKGPKVQPDIIKILWRFRLFNIVITADVAKMYRQVLMSPDDSELQRIIYRASPDQQLKHYKQKTVTYGTKPASFLATRCLFQLAEECDDPQIKRVIGKNFYVDDLLSGAQSDSQCLEIYTQLQARLGNAGFVLRKWCSNSTAMLERIPNAHDDPNFMVTLSENDVVSTLGLMWQPTADSFRFNLKNWSPPSSMTKRSLLSDINSVYDPIGLISPVLIKGKIFIQQLWSLKMSWDQILSEDLQAKWSNFYSNLQSLSSLSITRKVVCNQNSPIQIHGFCDASQEAFGACVYLRSIDNNGCVHVTLFTSKSRVAPLQPTTIPRLELCGALLLADLVAEVKTELKILDIQIDASDVYLWSDSTIVIAWIKSLSLFQAYVANRLSRIREVSSPDQWRHVSTQDNPADLITRGAEAKSFSHCGLWWTGPKWLSNFITPDPKNVQLPNEDLPELRTVKLILVNAIQNNEIFDRFSSWTKLIRVTGWLIRFIQNAKLKAKQSRSYDPLSVLELSAAQNIRLRHAQLDFSEEVEYLQKGFQVPNRSHIKSLNPFIDNDGIIRVGGRLSNASIADHRKFPIVLSSKHRLTQLLFLYEHLRLLHAGPQALVASIQTRFWPMGARDIARSVVRKCVTCFEFKPRFSVPLMASLPKERVSIERPFNRSGVDFCGPILIKSGIRRVTAIKCYISVFICFTTRAIHLELVSNLTTDAFLAALTRFMLRRGVCSHIHSDNITNFVGANKVLKQLFQLSKNNQSVVDEIASRGVQWHFIPPAAPHFGGLWEAAVKSAKHHLLKATKWTLLNFEEMGTLLYEIELIVNFRPLTACSSEPSDYEALTPNHFLVGWPATLPQQLDVSTIPQNRLRRFELMRQQVQLFWKRWSMEYLPQLHQRGKWTTLGRNIEIGDLAILKEDNVAPLQWKLVRVVATHPEVDGIVRVITVKRNSGIQLKRPVAKLALLPKVMEEDISTVSSSS